MKEQRDVLFPRTPPCMTPQDRVCMHGVWGVTERHIKTLCLLFETSRDSVWNEGAGRKSRVAQEELKRKPQILQRRFRNGTDRCASFEQQAVERSQDQEVLPILESKNSLRHNALETTPGCDGHASLRSQVLLPSTSAGSWSLSPVMRRRRGPLGDCISILKLNNRILSAEL